MTTTQLTFADIPVPKPKRYEFEKQARAICEAVGDGEYRSLAQIETALNYRYGQSGISARIRELHRGLLPGWDSQHKTERANGAFTVHHFYRIWKVTP